jgi:predicted transcriptional regulator
VSFSKENDRERIRTDPRQRPHHPQKISEGLDDTQKITAKTTLENHHVSYSFEKLEDLGFIIIEKPDKMVERVIDGQKRVFQHPKHAELTEKGHRYLENLEHRDPDGYNNLSKKELVEKTRTLEARLKELESKFEVFRKQVRKLI